MKLKSTQSPIELRPKCKIVDVKLSKKDLIRAIHSNLINGKDIAFGTFDTENDRFELKLPVAQRHFWSPKMFIWIDEDKGKTSISCILGPNYKIWNLFIVLYSLSILLILIGFAMGIYQKYSNEDPYYFWAVPVGLFFIILLNIAARIGQHWGKNQVNQLKSFISMIIDTKI